MTDKLKRVGFLGSSGGVCFASQGFDASLARAGENTGNFLFQNAMWQSIYNPKTEIDFATDSGMVKDNFDLLVFPAANQVNPSWDLGWWAKFIEDVDLPIVVVGLGAQAAIDGSHKITLQPGTMRFLKVISDRTSKIGVRGRYTQDVLNYLGIKNTIVTGCPSNFTNSFLSGQDIIDNINRLKLKDRFSSYYLYGTMEKNCRQIERTLFDFAKRNGSQIVYQTNRRLLHFIHDGTLDDDIENYLKWERDFISPNVSFKDHCIDIRTRGCFYSHANHWIDEVGRADVSFGMRIHGSIAAVQGGSLGLCVPFDSRTKELVDTMKYPFIRAEDITDGVSANTLWSKIHFDHNAFDKQRNILRVRYLSILKDASIIVV